MNYSFKRIKWANKQFYLQYVSGINGQKQISIQAVSSPAAVLMAVWGIISVNEIAQSTGRSELWSAGQHGCSYGLPLATRHTTELTSDGGREKGRVIYTDIKWFWCTTGGRSPGLMWPSSLHSRPSEADLTTQRPNLSDLSLHITHDQRCLQTSPARSQPLTSGFLPARNMRPGNGIIFIASVGESYF